MTEAQFERVVQSNLKRHGCTAYRIETGRTSIGVPDLFVEGRGDDFWLECKRVVSKVEMPVGVVDDVRFKIPWRASQLVWLRRYAQAHTAHSGVVSKCAWTCALFDNERDRRESFVVCVRHVDSPIVGNVVYYKTRDVFAFPISTFRGMDVGKFFISNAYVNVGKLYIRNAYVEIV